MKPLLILIGLLTMVKFFVALHLELGIDEAYYYTYTQPLQWSYFDHPLMVGVMQYLSTFGLHWNSEFFLRLFPLLFGVLNPLLVYKIGLLIGNQKSAFIAAMLYLSSIYASIIAGLFILPDAPLSFFGLCAIYFSILFIQRHSIRFLYLFALSLALAICSKYQAVFIGLAMAFYIVKYNQYYLQNIHLYIAVAIVFLGFVPTLVWNAEHQWINFSFHSGRIGQTQWFEYFPRELVGQIIYQNPMVFGLLVFAFIHRKKAKNIFTKPITAYLGMLSFPLILISLVLSIRTATFPHWSGIAYVGLFLWGGSLLAQQLQSYRSLYIAYFFVLFSLLFGYLEVQNGWLSNAISSHQPIDKKGENDPTQDLYGWEQLHFKFKKMQAEHPEISTQLILSHRWFPAGQMSYYLARNNNMNVIVEGPLYDSHQFSFKDNAKFWQENNNYAYCLAKSNSSFRPETQFLSGYDIQAIDTLYILRKNDTVRTHFVYLMHKNDSYK